MSSLNFKPEIDSASAVAEYLKEVLLSGSFPDIQDECPVVTFYDPMSIDEANRIVVMIGSAQSRPEQAGAYIVDVEIGVKSRWSQATVKDDFKNHFDRAQAVREALWVKALADNLEQCAPEGLGINFVSPNRMLKHDSYGTNPTGWLLTTTTLQLTCYSKDIT